MALRLHSSTAALFAAALLWGCAGSQQAVRPASVEQKPAVAPVPQRPGLVFQVEPPDAQIVIDGKSYGRVAELAGTGGLVPLDPGLYQVSLKAPGYVTWRAEVAVRGEKPEAIQINLSKR